MDATTLPAAPATPATLTPAPGPTIPDYVTVRMAAEWASGVRAQPLWFDYGGALTMRTTPGMFGPVISSSDATRPLLESLVFTAGGAAGAYTFSGSTTSALFWTESAVEKFLLPYFASVAAWEAGEFLLDKFVAAFYGYDSQNVQVYALAYNCGPAPVSGPITAADLIGVLFAPCTAGSISGPLQMLPLPAFLATPGFIGSGPISPTSQGVFDVVGLLGSVALDGSGNMGSVGCRELAEAASGTRGQFLYYVEENGRVDLYACPGPTPCGVSGSVIFTSLTNYRRPDRPTPTQVQMTIANAPPATILGTGSLLPHAPDSAFWTDGAVEKFLLPYYASVKGRLAPYFISLLLGEWDGVLGAATLDDPQAVVSAAEAAEGSVEASGVAVTNESTVFASIHLPRSETVPTEVVEDGNSIAVQFRTFFLHVVQGTIVAKKMGG